LLPVLYHHSQSDDAQKILTGNDSSTPRAYARESILWKRGGELKMKDVKAKVVAVHVMRENYVQNTYTVNPKKIDEFLNMASKYFVGENTEKVKK
jgi:hypothetical protein